MNHRKGLIRLYVVWFIIWAFVFWLGHTRESNGWIILTDRKYASIADQGAEIMQNGELLQVVAFCMALILPVALLIIYFVGRWIYRGFKADTHGRA